MRKLGTAATLGTLGYLLMMGAVLLPQLRYAGFIIAGAAWILLGTPQGQRVLTLTGILLIASGSMGYVSEGLPLGAALLVCFIVLSVASRGFEMYAHFKASSTYRIAWFWWSGVARILMLALLAAFSAILAFIVMQSQAPTIDEALRRATPALRQAMAALLAVGGLAELAASLLSILAFSTLGSPKDK